MDYENLIIISQNHRPLELKEFLDIALVSASYDKPTALYLSAEVLHVLNHTESPELIYTIKMLADFSVAIFSEDVGELLTLAIQPADLADLQSRSRTVFPF